MRAMLTPGEGVVSPRGKKSLGTAGLAAINRGGGWDAGGGSDMSGVEERLDNIAQMLADQDRLLPKRLISAAQTASRSAA